jgi:16S rRNA (uracil1498-N3)-methyltransferase
MLIFKQNIFNCNFTVNDTHIKTMRPKEGAVLRITDLNGTIATIKILNYDFKTGLGEYKIIEDTKLEKQKDQILIQSIIDKNYLDKLCEIIPINNITKLVLVESDYSNVPNINLERLNLILTRSCEQCENPYLPTIELITKTKLTQYLKSNNTKATVLELPSKNNQTLTAKLDTIIVGPEGGFSPEEVLFFIDNQYPFYSLNCNVLPAWLAGYSYFSMN